MIHEPANGNGRAGARHFGAPSGFAEPCCSDCQPAVAPHFGIGAIQRLGAFANGAAPVGVPFWGAGGPEGPAANTSPVAYDGYVFVNHPGIGPYVDIFLSAGPHEKKSDGTTGASCEPQNGGNCGLYRVRWDLGAERAIEVEQLAVPVRWDGSGVNVGVEEPAVGNGDRIVMLYRYYGLEGGGEEGSFILSLPGAGGLGIIGDAGSHAKDRPQWPAFLDDDTLVYEKSEKEAGVEWRTMWTAPTATWAPKAVVGLKGTQNSPLPDGKNTKNVSYGNPQVDVSTGTARVVSFGIDETSPVDTVPHVTSATGTDRENFDLTGVPNFSNAQHPTWSRDGSRIMATRQDTAQHLDLTRDVRALYTFIRLGAAGTDWTVENRTFEPLDFDFMPSAYRGYACELLTFKYAHWCGDDDHVVATVYCSELSTDMIETSRVLLINIADPTAPVYHDITAVIAYAFPELAGPKKWRSVFSVCRDVV